MTKQYYKSLIKNDLIDSFFGSWRHHWDSTPLRPHINRLREVVEEDFVKNFDLHNIVIINPDGVGYIMTERRIVLSHVVHMLEVMEVLDKAGVRDTKGRRPTNKAHCQMLYRTIIVHEGIMYTEKDGNPFGYNESKKLAEDKEIIFSGIIADRVRLAKRQAGTR